MSRPARAVVFDRDGVLVRTRLGDLLRDLLPLLPLDEAELARRWRSRPDARALASAVEERDAAKTFLVELAAELDLPPAVQTELAAFDHGAYVDAYPDAAPALDTLRSRGLRVGVLTNNSAAMSASGPLVAAGLAYRVDVALSAQEIGAAKPERAAYLAVCAALAAEPDECLFFDNVEAWVEGARAVGMRAYRVDRERGEDDIDRNVIGSLRGIGALVEMGVGR